MLLIIYNIFLLFLVLTGLSFAALNAQIVHFNYFWGEIDIRLSLLLVVVLALGVLIGLASSLISWLVLKHENFKLKLKIKAIVNNSAKQADIFPFEK